jgi:Sap, sulfolipid-1-addressing protein
MGSAIYAPLVVLALIDSTSFGTLVIPIWLMLAPGRLRPGRILLYLFTIAGFYLVLGVALTVGAMAFVDQLRDVLGRTPAHVLQLLVGIALLVLGLTVEPLTKAGKAKRAAKRDARRAELGPDRIQRWRARATTGEGSASELMTLAVTAATIEAASMVPYLAAVGLRPAAPLVPSVLAVRALSQVKPIMTEARWSAPAYSTRPCRWLNPMLARAKAASMPSPDTAEYTAQPRFPRREKPPA